MLFSVDVGSKPGVVVENTKSYYHAYLTSSVQVLYQFETQIRQVLLQYYLIHR